MLLPLDPISKVSGLLVSVGFEQDLGLELPFEITPSSDPISSSIRDEDEVFFDVNEDSVLLLSKLKPTLCLRTF